MSHEDSLSNLISVVHGPDQSYPVPDSDTELDAAEQMFGAPLPASYRAFARRYGLGGKLHSLPELFRLLPIAGKRKPHWSDSIIEATRFWRSPSVIESEDDIPRDFLPQAIIFGCDEGQLTFLFHTGEVTDPARSEYRVYQIPRHSAPEPICESFSEWLLWVHNGYDPATWGEGGDDDDEESSDNWTPSSKMPYARYQDEPS